MRLPLTSLCCALQPSQPIQQLKTAHLLLLLLLGVTAVWLLHEQVGIALMECGALQQALPLVKAVLLKFPGSIRARRLQVGALSSYQQQQRSSSSSRSNVRCCLSPPAAYARGGGRWGSLPFTDMHSLAAAAAAAVAAGQGSRLHQ